ncbi:phytanoyl-CoA dioxygenase family protein [Novosphingobium colocasiae]
MVPLVQYRLYPPNGPITPVHQDGFYSPGIEGYRPVWTALVDCPREVGGLMIAVGEHKRGFFHNLARTKTFAIPEGVITPDSWATTDFTAGDVLVVHPHTPHAGTPNRSDRLRVTFDTRVQSAKHPNAFFGRSEGGDSNESHRNRGQRGGRRSDTGRQRGDLHSRA